MSISPSNLNTVSSASTLGGTNGLEDRTASLLGADAFMKLLIAQLQNQDPQAPADSKEMITQLSQLSGVQEMTNMRTQIENMTIAMAGISNQQAVGMVGRTVSASGDTSRLRDIGQANFGFTLAGRATQVTVTITNEAGDVVRTAELGETFPGEREFVWDGQMNDGRRAPEGRYTMSVSAVGESGTPVASSTDVRGTVAGISYDNGYPELIVGARRVMMGNIKQIEL